MTNDGSQAYAFDEANRILTVGSYSYTYSGVENKRILAYNSANASAPTATFNLYGPDGKRLGWYRYGTSNGWTSNTTQGFTNYLYLGNKPLNYAEDRTGSNRSGETYYPYGNPYGNVDAGAENQSFGTYVQDSGSGLLYADQRYYHPGYGRFLTADRSNANIDYGGSATWNRYAYTNGDPVNGMDATGLGDDFDGGLGDPSVGPGGLVGEDTCPSGFCGSSGGNDGFDGPTYHQDVFCPPSCPPLVELPPADPDTNTGSPDWINLAPPTQSNCVARYVAVGVAVGVGVGSTVGGAGGALVGGAVGTGVEPGGGTIVLGVLGAEIGSNGGALAGGSFGGGLGGILGNILCSSRSGDYRDKTRGANANDGRVIRDVARQAGIDPRKFGDFVEDEKSILGMGPSDNFSYSDLVTLAAAYIAAGGH